MSQRPQFGMRTLFIVVACMCVGFGLMYYGRIAVTNIIQYSGCERRESDLEWELQIHLIREKAKDPRWKAELARNVDWFEGKLEDGAEDEREDAALLLGAISAPGSSTEDLLIEKLGKESPRVTRALVFSLGEMGSLKSKPKLLELIKTDDIRIAAETQAALDKLRSREPGQADPLRHGASQQYRYCANRPTVLNDPAGLLEMLQTTVTLLDKFVSADCSKGSHQYPYPKYKFIIPDPDDPEEDPAKKKKIPIPVKFELPGASGLYSFRLSKPPPCSALFVAKVSVVCSVSSCSDACKCPKDIRAERFSYVEVFRRIEKTNRVSNDELNSGFTDAVNYHIVPPSCGSYTQDVEIRVYCRTKADADPGLPGDTEFIQDQIFKVAVLPKNPKEGWGGSRDMGKPPYCNMKVDNPTFTVGQEPDFWKRNKGIAVPTTRSFLVDFDCCPGVDKVSAGFSPDTE